MNTVEIASLVRQIVLDTLKTSAPGIAEQMREAIANSVTMKLRAMPRPAVSFLEAMNIVERGFDTWKDKPHNAKWYSRIDGTPIQNDLKVNIAEAICHSALTSTSGDDPAQRAHKPDEWELAKFLCEKLALEDFDEMSRTKYLGDAKAILEFISAVTSHRCPLPGELEADAWVASLCWQPIETAPKDEDVLLGWWRDWPEPCWESASGLAGSTKGGWLHGQATHWQPLPAPPSTHTSTECGETKI